MQKPRRDPGQIAADLADNFTCLSVVYQTESVACGKGCIMIQPVALRRDLAGLPLLKERDGHPTDAESLQSFTTLAAYRDGGIYATHFSGSSG